MIDLHAHVVLDSVLGAAGHLGPELDDGDQATGRPPCFRVGSYTLVGVRYRDSPFMDLDRRLDAMDEAGIDLQVLSPNPLTYFSHVETEWADRFCRRHDDELAALVGPSARPPPRLRPAPDAGSRPGCGGARAGRGGSRSPGALPGHRPGPPARRPGFRRGVERLRRARRPGLLPPRPRRHRSTSAGRTAGPLRRRPVARLPLRGDAGGVVARAGGSPRPPSRPRRLHQPRGWRDIVVGGAHGARGCAPGPGPTTRSRNRAPSRSDSGASGGTRTSEAHGRSPPSSPPSARSDWWRARTWPGGTSPAIRHGATPHWPRRWTTTPAVCCGSTHHDRRPSAMAPDAGTAFG